MGKLKQSVPQGVSPNNDLFIGMFLIRLLPSMQESVGSVKPQDSRGDG
jgi:hypothetical protein